MKRILLNIFLITSVAAAQTQKLSETGLYEDIVGKTVSPVNRLFSPQYPLWTDGAVKNRWIYLPPNTQIITGKQDETPEADKDHWTFPVGTKFWKEFAFPKVDGFGVKRVETRLLEKVEDNKWEFSAYVWNEEESEATLAPAAGIPDVYPSGTNTKHDIPSKTQCLSCHRRGGDIILGFDAIQLSDDRDPLAIGFQPDDKGLTLKTLIEENLLSHVPQELAISPKIHAKTPEGRASLGYLHGNCGNCHNPSGIANWTGLFFRHTLDATIAEEEPGFATAVDQLTQSFQIPDVDETFRIKAGNADHSAVIYRMKNFGFARMPPFGSKVVDEQAVTLLSDWANNL